ncbi:dethiobiotin synthetase [Variovorax paradoxus]|uniref:ATP-dependent dethiobiotin synthetase BioD n=1 Tax=Variovorax paradoxus TaxID=34073 RepID=A0AAE4C0W9_VARPD|nr:MULTISPECIES: dethiobiotin synthase [Variovorax]MDP9966986.1 dethiobiotin synthetase [Variovorax paradoxus]MDR6429604.1 dethiobiotin synthetase [Variovorax paradoxus]
MTHRRWFVTGTDTGVGKTLASGAMLSLLAASGLRAVGMKPVAAGLELIDGAWRNEDVEQLRAAGNVDAPLALRCPYLLRAPMSPHLAAREEGARIELPPLLSAFAALSQCADAVVVEGVGGFCVPFGDDIDIDSADLAVALGLPVILVVGLRLGCLNHALLTAEAIRTRGLMLAGWIASTIEPEMLAPEANLQTLRDRLGAPLLGVVPHLAEPSAAHAARHLDLRALRATAAHAARRSAALA